MGGGLRRWDKERSIVVTRRSFRAEALVGENRAKLLGAGRTTTSGFT